VEKRILFEQYIHLKKIILNPWLSPEAAAGLQGVLRSLKQIPFECHAALRHKA
jgi:hypothetical protein